MKNQNQRLGCLLLVFFLTGCTPEIEKEKAYYAKLATPETLLEAFQESDTLTMEGFLGVTQKEYDSSLEESFTIPTKDVLPLMESAVFIKDTSSEADLLQKDDVPAFDVEFSQENYPEAILSLRICRTLQSYVIATSHDDILFTQTRTPYVINYEAGKKLLKYYVDVFNSKSKKTLSYPL
jgi:hypothetical protein